MIDFALDVGCIWQMSPLPSVHLSAKNYWEGREEGKKVSVDLSPFSRARLTSFLARADKNVCDAVMNGRAGQQWQRDYTKSEARFTLADFSVSRRQRRRQHARLADIRDQVLPL